MEVALYDDENSLVLWATETRRVLELCGKDAPYWFSDASIGETRRLHQLAPFIS